jgi:hypothetical protein
LRGLFRTVIAAILNCVIFGVGASVYLLTIELITSTAALAGWQQILLIFLTGLVMWLLLRPFRRITSLANHNPFGDMVGSLGEMRRRTFGDLRSAGASAIGSYAGNRAANAEEDESDSRRTGRPEMWTRTGAAVAAIEAAPDSPADPLPAHAVGAAAGSGASPPRASTSERSENRRETTSASRPRPGPGRPETGGGVDYRDPDYAVSTRGEVLPVESDQSYVIYRPDRGLQTVASRRQAPASRPEAASSAKLGMAAASVSSAAAAVRELADSNAPVRDSGRRPE